jgi:hypothetical protein
MKKYLTLRNLSISFILSISVALLQYNADKSRHERLSGNGITVRGRSTFSATPPGYATFSFTIPGGKTITRTEKHSHDEFLKHYQPLIVIYNADNPEEFEPLYDFSIYSSWWRFFFFLFLYPLLLTFFFILMYRNISLLIPYIRSRRSK